MNPRAPFGMIGTGIALAIVALVAAALLPVISGAAHFAYAVAIVLIVIGVLIVLFNFIRGIL